MKAILEIPEREISFEFENLKIDQFKILLEKPNDEIPFFIEKYTNDEHITLITSNMPESLRVEIVNIIMNYCNH